MRGKQLLLILAVALVSLVLMAGGGTPTRAFVAPGIQDFNLDMVNCLLPSYPPDTVSPNPELGYPQVCNWGEDKTVNGSAAYSTAIGLIAGNRLGSPYVYSGPGWVLQSDAQIANGTQVGDVALAEDYFQDGYVDWAADSSNCGGPPKNCSTALTFATAIPEQYIKQGLTFGPGTGWAGTDESYLNELTPGAAAMARYVRYRALVDTFYILGKYRVDVVALNGAPTPLNLVNLSPVWSPAGTYVNLIQLGGEAASPTTGLPGQDSPQASISHTNAPYAANPAAAGLYARWTTEISAADQADGALNFVYSTSCKAIGGTFPDADADCLATVANAGGPADPNDANPDIDGDGLLDGVEVAWGSCPGGASFPGLAGCAGLTDVTSRDTDGDGRTDTEEMVGPTQFLTNPKVWDTDADGVPDGGLTLDWNADGVPDCPDQNGDGMGNSPSCLAFDPSDTGMSANLDISADGSSHRRVGFRIVGWDIEPDGAGTDNCPSIPNGPSIPGPGGDIQNNFDLDSATSWGHGDLYGDACDSDDENDGFNDVAELRFQWDSGAHSCANDPDLPGPATPLSLNNPDSDNDGVLDGVECEVGSNPANAWDSPGAPALDPDKDGVSNYHETYKRTQGFSNQPSPPVGNEDVDGDGLIGQGDPDSDGDTLSDGCEVYVAGTNPMMVDSDFNGTPDAAEPNLAARIAAHCGAADDLDYDGALNDVDNCLFVNAAQTNTQPFIGNGRGIAGNDKSVPWNPYNWGSSSWNDKRGDACDGDWDNDGIPNASDADPSGDITYDDNADGAWKGTGDDGPSWDTNMNDKLDGVQALCPVPGPWGWADSDGDGLKNSWEFCKWGSSPNRVDSDGDAKGDCVEVADVNGDGAVTFPVDLVYYLDAAFLSPAAFGKDGDFDLDGDGVVDFVSDVIREARFALIPGLCK